MRRGGYPDWPAILAPYGFNQPTLNGNLKWRDVRFIYFVQCDQLTKVGLANNVKQRLHDLRLGSPRGLYLRGTRAVPRVLAMQIEKRIHAALKEHAIGREWFRILPALARREAQPVIDRAWAAYDRLTELGFASELR